MVHGMFILYASNIKEQSGSLSCVIIQIVEIRQKLKIARHMGIKSQ